MTHFPHQKVDGEERTLITLEELDTITTLPHPQREEAFLDLILSRCVWALR